MPNAAAPIAQPTARFLAIGAPAAPDKAPAGAFAAVLADKTADKTEPVTRQSGKALPEDRQDLAASRPLQAADDVDGDEPEAETEETAKDDKSLDLAATLMPLVQPVIAKPILPVRTKPPVAGTVDPIRLLSDPVESSTTEPVGAAPVRQVTDMPSVEDVKPVAPTVAEPKSANAVEFVLRATSTSVPAPAVPAPIAAAETPASADPASGDATTAKPLVTTTILAPALSAGPTPIVASASEAPATEMPSKPEVVTLAVKPDTSAPDDIRTRAVAQPMIEARAVATAARSETAIDAAPVKSRTRVTTSTLAELTGVSSTAAIDVRAVTATTAAATLPTLPQDRAAAMMDTIQALRSEMKGDGLNLSIDHKDFGPISVRFDRAQDGVSVRFDARDAEAARAIADAAPQFKQATDPSGLRFERRDTLGASTGGSQDAPRQGREQTSRTQTLSNLLPQARETRDDSGIFA